LSATLLNLNQHLRLIGNTRRILWETASYPIVVALLALAVVAFFFTFLMPRFEEIYTDFNARLPALTVLVLAIGRDFPSVLTAVVVVVVLFMAIWRLLRRTHGGRVTRESLTLKVPLLGRIYRASIIAGFLRSVSTAIGTGISLPRAVRLSCEATGSPLLLEDGRRLAGELERGESAFNAVRSALVIPPLFGYCVQAAASRADLPAALAKLAHAYEARAFHVQSLLRAFVLPFFIILLGGFLGLAIIGVFLPLVSLVDSVSGGM
jgi:type IV pilus assembly protein PilC